MRLPHRTLIGGIVLLLVVSFFLYAVAATVLAPIPFPPEVGVVGSAISLVALGALVGWVARGKATP